MAEKKRTRMTNWDRAKKWAAKFWDDDLPLDFEPPEMRQYLTCAYYNGFKAGQLEERRKAKESRHA